MESTLAPLSYKGVVFNEMKGNYSSPDNMLQQFSKSSLYPDITYGLDSGGDPRNIPDLSYEQFKAFHARHYHPSNARLFFYGDDDPNDRLRRLKCGFGRLIDLFRAEPVAGAKHGRSVVVVMAVEEYERMKALDAPAAVRAPRRKAKQ